MKQKCKDCQGTGKIMCDCTGGYGPDLAAHSCPDCNGTGYYKCPTCNGTGEQEVEE